MIKIFKIIADLEGISYILLFTNMLVIKKNDLDLYNIILFPLGMSHGILFVAYLFLALFVKIKVKWSNLIFFKVCLASLLPFATFYVEKNYLRNKE